MQITTFPSASAAGEALATEIVDGIRRAGAAGTRYLLGCPGGRSPRSTYRALTSQVAAGEVDLRPLVVVMMDDYVLPDGDGFARAPADAHYSVRRFAATEIVAPLNAAARPGRGVTADRLWFPDPADPAGYDRMLRDAGHIDLFILASGASDGHVAFNPPGTAFDAPSRIVELAESTRRDNLGTFPDFGGLDEVPRHGITIGVGTIAALSDRAVLVVDGEHKQRTVQRLAAADTYQPDWPATVIAVCRNASVYADPAAAAGLDARHIVAGATRLAPATPRASPPEP